MRPVSLCFGATGALFFILCISYPASSQIVGCDGAGLECPTKDMESDDGVCVYSPNDIGVVSFTSNVTSDGPLTWTVTESDGKGAEGKPASYRTFWLGSPPSLTFEKVTNFGACAVALSNVSATLQLPNGFDDFGDFGCPTVMGDRCAQDIFARVHNELLRILDDPAYQAGEFASPCGTVTRNLQDTQLPASCVQPFESGDFSFGRAWILTNDTELIPSMYQEQGDCSITTGGPNYHLVSGPDEYLEGKPKSDEIKLFKNGTTPIFTFFYNQPWNNATTGPAPFLEQPEVHLSCVRTVPSAKQESGALRVGPAVGLLPTPLLCLCSLFWMALLT